MGQVELKAATRYRLEAEPEVIVFGDRASDFLGNLSLRNTFTAVKPIGNTDYYVRFRAVTPKSISRPIAKIVSATKATATTTATIVTDAPHGLTTASYVTIKGIANQTVFANFATPTVVASVIDANTFTIVIGTATIATSYGGTVILCNGQVDQQGIIGQVPQSIARNADGIVTVIGNGTWSGLNIGEYVNLHGIRNVTNGGDLGFDGVYKVHNVSTATLLLEPVEDISGAYVVNGNGIAVTPTGGVVTTTNCGGAVILRTTLRSHDIVLATYSQSLTKIMGQGSYRADMALPVVHLGTLPVAQSTGASISSTTGLGGWYMHPAIVGLPDIASAAITTSATSSAVANNLGNGFQINIAVTAAPTGTNPTLDVRIEESFDGGTNWVTSYEMQRITTNGSYNTPVLRAMGRHIRYVQTVGGTTPSFTRAVTRNVLPFIPAEPQKRIMDRSIVLTTLNSVTPTLFQAAANNVQLVINLGAATTPPALQLEGSEDGTNWYAMGTPLTGVANNTVQVTISGLSATYVRARVSTIGTAVVAGYVSIKAWS